MTPPDTQKLQPAQSGQRLLRVLHDGTLGHFQLQASDIEAGFAENAFHIGDQPGVDQMPRRNVGAESSEIVKTIVELARFLDMEVVAEGVETEDQLRTVATLGCEYVQGYYFARPLYAQLTHELMQERSQLQHDLALV